MYQTVYEKLNEIDDRTLTEALVNAALQNKKFPLSMKMDSLQAAWLKYKQDEKLKGKFVNAIFHHIREEGTTAFRKALETSSPEELNRELIEFLQAPLKINGAPQSFIEATIRDGKVLWRTIDAVTGKPLENLSASKTGLNFKYDATTCFRMTPDEFNQFKKAKKFFGVQPIDRESFIADFKRHYLNETITYIFKDDYIGNIWNELKSTGILDKNNRLTGDVSMLSHRLSRLGSFDTKSNGLLSKIFSTLEHLNGAVLTVPGILDKPSSLINVGQARRLLRDGLKKGTILAVDSKERRLSLFWKQSLWIDLPETDRTMIQQVKTVVAKR